MNFKNLFFAILCINMPNYVQSQEFDLKKIDEYWQTGKTLPLEVSLKYPLPKQPVINDNGLNVMIDIAHQCSFEMMWNTPNALIAKGFRVASSQASLNTVLDPKGVCRVRIRTNPEDKIYPFAWHPNFEFNVIVTQQSTTAAQEYLPEEISALKNFVNKGGGLIILAPPQRDSLSVSGWTLNNLCKAFGVTLSTNTDKVNNIKHIALQADNKWEVMESGERGLPVKIKGKYGRGRVIVCGSMDLSKDINTATTTDAEKKQSSREQLGELIKLASAGKKPVGGEPRLPMAPGGGGGIYPELEKKMDDIVLLYAKNQKKELIRTVEVDIPKAKLKVEQWLPSKPTLEPMYLILSAGGGGGWAVNAFKPKENGIISLEPFGVLSIFGHELAHTMAGPVNDQGIVAGITPDPFQDRGEAHAGWFQGKINAIFDESQKSKANKNCNSFFTFDPSGDKLDLAGDYKKDPDYKKGHEWSKTWYVWQKLDDRYGPTWYARWRWVQHTRWKDQPLKKLTWDEMVEDMSIAVGEDLFPFFKKLGTTLTKQRFETAEFGGETLNFKIAPIEPTPAGNVNIENIGDFTKKIVLAN